MGTNSSYYYNQFNTYKKEAADCDKNIKVLTKIKESLTDDFYDEQSSVNVQMCNLKEDLEKAVRHDGTFSRMASSYEVYKEKTSTADKSLNNVVIALENEIAALGNKKTTAEQNSDEQYQSYNDAKQQEKQEWMNSLINGH